MFFIQPNNLTLPSSKSAFMSLSHRRLPIGTLQKWTPRLFFAAEHAMPIEGVGSRLKEYVDNCIYVLTAKGMNLHLWRCSEADSPRPLLLVDRHVGFGRHAWCLLDFSRPGGGDDVNVKIHQVYPRHLDILDWTGLRYVGFVFVVLEALIMALSIFSSQPAREREYKQGQASAAILLLGCFLAASAGFVNAFATHTFWWPSGFWISISCLVFAILAGFILFVFEAKEPLTDMQRFSAELISSVQLSLQTATVTMQPTP